jgi:serine/threonine protein kinase
VTTLACLACGSPLHERAFRCEVCGIPIEVSDVLEIGTLISGRYRVESILGRGGFGVTYRALHGMLGKEVAIKELFPAGATRRGATVIAPTTAGNEAFQQTRARFIEEGRTLGMFQLPGTVRVLDALDDNGTTYLVMEMLEGPTLEKLVREEGPLVEDQVVWLIEHLATTLGHLHQGGVLHRDIKPANVIMVPNRGPVLIDFGSARQLISQSTRSATAMVSHGYAPIEQYQQHGTFGPPTDLYGLGATAYYATTAEEPPSSIDRLTGGAPLTVPLPDGPCRRVIEACLQINAANRLQTSAAVLEQVRAAPTIPSSGVPAPDSPKSPDQKSEQVDKVQRPKELPLQPLPEPDATVATSQRILWLRAFIAIFAALVLLYALFAVSN